MNPILEEVLIIEEFKQQCEIFETNYLTVIKHMLKHQEMLETFCEKTNLTVN